MRYLIKFSYDGTNFSGYQKQPKERTVEGEFEKDDIVQIVSPDGVAFAAGRIACSSDRARALIGAQGGRPLIHYDYLYIDRTRL